MKCCTDQMSVYLRELRNHDMNRGGDVGVLWTSKSKGEGWTTYRSVSLRQIDTVSTYRLDMEDFPIQRVCW